MLFCSQPFTTPAPQTRPLSSKPQCRGHSWLLFAHVSILFIGFLAFILLFGPIDFHPTSWPSLFAQTFLDPPSFTSSTVPRAPQPLLLLFLNAAPGLPSFHLTSISRPVFVLAMLLPAFVLSLAALHSVVFGAEYVWCMTKSLKLCLARALRVHSLMQGTCAHSMVVSQHNLKGHAEYLTSAYMISNSVVICVKRS